VTETLPNFTDAMLAACKAGAAQAAAAIGRAFQGEVRLDLGEKLVLQSAETDLELDGPGLIVLVKADRMTVVMTVPAAKGLVPEWCARPDSTGESKLATLAQELGMNLLPETWITKDFSARWVASLGAALGRGEVPQDAIVVPLAVTQNGQPAGNMGVIWPAANPDDFFAASPKELIGQAKNVEKPTLPLGSGDLPPYTRSLLRIKVPVIVSLAEKRQKLSRIIELGPGSIIQFEKSCEEMLELEVGNRAVASGEAVKVGDKFGLRITAMVLPEERFAPVTGKRH
jgi:flagellar motor switch protein FliN